MKNSTKFSYTVNGEPMSETAKTASVLEYNAVVNRLLAIADKDSLRATSI